MAQSIQQLQSRMLNNVINIEREHARRVTFDHRHLYPTRVIVQQKRELREWGFTHAYSEAVRHGGQLPNKDVWFLSDLRRSQSRGPRDNQRSRSRLQSRPRHSGARRRRPDRDCHPQDNHERDDVHPSRSHHSRSRSRHREPSRHSDDVRQPSRSHHSRLRSRHRGPSRCSDRHPRSESRPRVYDDPRRHDQDCYPRDGRSPHSRSRARNHDRHFGGRFQRSPSR